MPTIHHLLKQLSPDSNTKGKQFEKITQWFLQNEPEWQAIEKKSGYGLITLKSGA